MIRYTCLTGGSLAVEPPEGGGVVPRAGALASGGLVVGAAGALMADAAGDGEAVGSAGDGGASLPDEAPEASAGEELGAAAGVACEGGKTTFNGCRADAASVSGARELAAAPIAMPKPRKASTSSAEIRGEGRVSAALGAVLPAPGSAGCSRPCPAPSRRSRPSSSA